jgi:hypothetical protein
MDRTEIPYISLNIHRSRNNTFNTNKVLITESTQAYDLKRSVRNIKAQKKRELETFHSDTLKANFITTFHVDHNTLSHNIDYSYKEKPVDKDQHDPAFRSQSVNYNKTCNSNFFYKGLSSIPRAHDSVSDFLHKTQNIRKMKYSIDIQKEQIKRNKEEPENKLEEVKDKIASLKDYKELLDDRFFPAFDRYIKIVNKQVDSEKYILGKFQGENTALINEISKLDYNIKLIRDKLQTLKEYKMFLFCLNTKKSLKSMKVTESLTRKSSFHHAIIPPSMSPKKSLFRIGTLFSNTKFANDLSSYCHDEPIDYDPSILINQLTILEKDILDNMRRYDYNNMIITQLKKEMNDFEGECDEDDEEIKKAREVYIQVKKRNLELKKEKAISDAVSARFQCSKQIYNTYNLILNELPNLIGRVDESKGPLKKNLQMLSFIEKTIGFLLSKYEMYSHDDNLKSQIKELEKINDKDRRARQFMKKKLELDLQTQKRIEKEERKYHEMKGNSKIRKVAPRVKPFCKEVFKQTKSMKTLREEFNDYVMYNN